ncbi:Structural maintenance of chromosomes protein 2 [Malassezia caprae]|uniref:Structural maintenance of chromosomes protein n=1 Tax=Malassezia caprae TaxID=1381934 RepID=A0AAF0E3A8_9BASI|nr:Structural maintenance of chromosomes protein 2 [Malassezia caprae]
MRIEELIIDGFKSYPVRTHVRGFDPSFNAITGLNGSGKSNILDAICFVLGLTNLSSVRASNIQDLIYKRGQAGVTKASVTIVFDNSDTERSPVAFENYASITVTRQIAMGGASKYLINGHKATQQAVQNLFQSVQLNVNNPNFLIMQGKITKVLNMKPAEILAMIEEATGTRMFEERKERAFRTMAKKDQKVREITTLLDEEIRPKLDKLREEKRAFLEYQKATTELERLLRLAKAHEWQTLQTQLESRERTGVQRARERLTSTEADIHTWKGHMQSLKEEMEALERRRTAKLGSKHTSLLDEAKALNHELVEATAQQEFRQSAHDEEAQRVETEAAALEAAEAELATHKSSFTELDSSFQAFKTVVDRAGAELGEQEALLQTLLTGMASGDQDTHGGFQGQLAKAKERESAARSEIEQAHARIQHMERECRAKEPQLQREQANNRKLVQQRHDAQRTADEAHAALDAQGWDEARYQSLQAERQRLQAKITELTAQRDSMQERLPAALQFRYEKPSRDFDTSKVKGLVASLVRLDPAKLAYATALETCAGGRLYSVVVQDEQVGAQLLAHGQLKKRVTLIPLTKIQAHVAPAAKVAAAQALAPGKVDLALSLIGYENEVAQALEYVFGSTLVCKDAATAKKVTFDQAVRMKSVTLEGDVYDPAGTLSGGSSSGAQSSVLLRMHELAMLMDQIQESSAALQATEETWRQMQKEQRCVAQLQSDYERKLHQATLLQQQVEHSRAATLEAELSAIRARIDELRASMVEAEARANEAAAQAAQLERDISELSTDKDGKVARVREACRTHKAQHTERMAELKKQQAALRAAELEVGQRQMDADAARERLDDARRALAQAATDLGAGVEALEALRERVAEKEAAVAEEQASLQTFSEDHAALQKVLGEKKHAIGEAELAMKHAQRELEQHEHECEALRVSVAALEETYPWILEECAQFGRPGSAYEFDKHNMRDVKQLCRQLEEQQSGLKRKVNPRVMNMIDNVEKKDASLQHMLSTVLRDKNKIEQTITELDRYKKDALQTTFEQVSRDFGAIFGELLPGNYAALQPPEGMDLTQGLEVRVRLGQTWKQSLAELSGGQRSLIALSLIMSLLQFNPAPMYILDEVDAALDLSHTQHIGHLFRTRFKGSQFIVVSLKEGLFSNANVLFRARFRDGTSVVERVAQKSADSDRDSRARRPLAAPRGAPRVASGSVAVP